MSDITYFNCTPSPYITFPHFFCEPSTLFLSDVLFKLPLFSDIYNLKYLTNLANYCVVLLLYEATILDEAFLKLVMTSQPFFLSVSIVIKRCSLKKLISTLLRAEIQTLPASFKKLVFVCTKRRQLIVRFAKPNNFCSN